MTAQALENFQPVGTLPTSSPTPPAPQVTPPATNVGAVNPAAVGANQRISTRVPDAVGAEEALQPHSRSDLEVGLDATRIPPPGASQKTIDGMADARRKNADLIRSYSHIRTEGLNDDQVHEAFVNHLKDNLVWLHDQIDPAIRAESKRWYDGARNITDKWAQQYQYQPHQIAGVLAALSPQKDWFQNVDLAKRILDISRDQLDTRVSPEMQARMAYYVSKVKKDENRAQMQRDVDAIGTKTLGQIKDPMQRAIWVRAYDEAHNPREYRTVTPDGDFGDVAKTADRVVKDKTVAGKPQKVAWGSFKEIHKAMEAARDPSLANISRNMGGNHKVRNFYNNIIAPNYGRDATVDTHAIAAANMIPAGSGHELVGAGLGLKGSSSAATGTRGLYPHYIEAHRRAAAEISARDNVRMLPRELQSITWEGIRGTFTPEQKRNEAFVAANKAIWDSYGRGDIDADTARQRVLEHAAPQGIRDPKWVRSGAADDAE